MDGIGQGLDNVVDEIIHLPLQWSEFGREEGFGNVRVNEVGATGEGEVQPEEDKSEDSHPNGTGPVDLDNVVDPRGEHEQHPTDHPELQPFLVVILLGRANRLGGAVNGIYGANERDGQVREHVLGNIGRDENNCTNGSNPINDVDLPITSLGRFDELVR